jgi:hypothetical protein
MAKAKEVAENKSNWMTFIVWVLLGLLVVSGVVNFVTLLSIQGLKRTVDEMRDPVNIYFSKKLDAIEAGLDAFEAETTPERGKSPYVGDIKKLRKNLNKTRELWNKTSRISGPRWLNFYWKAQLLQDKTEQAWQELEAQSP